MKLKEQLRHCIAEIVGYRVDKVPFMDDIGDAHQWLRTIDRSITLTHWEAVQRNSDLQLCLIKCNNERCYVVVRQGHRQSVKFNPSNADIERHPPDLIAAHVIYRT